MVKRNERNILSTKRKICIYKRRNKYCEPHIRWAYFEVIDSDSVKLASRFDY